jgi:peptide/nickel transport system ATP-binding protein
MSTLLSTNDLNIKFMTERGISHVVKDVSFSIAKGETLGLVGESGCGKSVTSRALMRLISHPGKITSGKIILSQELPLEDIDITKASVKEMQYVRGQSIGMIFQEPDSALNPIMKIGDQITETLFIQYQARHKFNIFNSIQKLRNKKNFWDKSIKILQKLDILDPESVVNLYPHQLSGGMKQRILIAIALAGSPSLLISDEATSNLDVTVQSQIIRLLDQLKSTQIINSILFITHDLGLASLFCNRIAVMYAGCICEIGVTPDIFQSSLHPYTHYLLETIPRKDSEKNLKPISGQVPDLIDPPEGCRFHPRCKHAINKCKTINPKLESINNERMVACWNIIEK